MTVGWQAQGRSYWTVSTFSSSSITLAFSLHHHGPGVRTACPGRHSSRVLHPGRVYSASPNAVPSEEVPDEDTNETTPEQRKRPTTQKKRQIRLGRGRRVRSLALRDQEQEELIIEPSRRNFFLEQGGLYFDSDSDDEGPVMDEESGYRFNADDFYWNFIRDDNPFGVGYDRMPPKVYEFYTGKPCPWKNYPSYYHWEIAMQNKAIRKVEEAEDRKKLQKEKKAQRQKERMATQQEGKPPHQGPQKKGKGSSQSTGPQVAKPSQQGPQYKDKGSSISASAQGAKAPQQGAKQPPGSKAANRQQGQSTPQRSAGGKSGGSYTQGPMKDGKGNNAQRDKKAGSDRRG